MSYHRRRPVRWLSCQTLQNHLQLRQYLGRTIVVSRDWFVRVSAAQEVQSDKAVRGGEGGELVAPAHPAVGEAVEQEDGRVPPLACFNVVEFCTLKCIEFWVSTKNTHFANL